MCILMLNKNHFKGSTAIPIRAEKMLVSPLKSLYTFSENNINHSLPSVPNDYDENHEEAKLNNLTHPLSLVKFRFCYSGSHLALITSKRRKGSLKLIMFHSLAEIYNRKIFYRRHAQQ